MPEEVFDVASLAKYLHLSPQQVQKLVKRDEIPSRLVGGKPRFSRAEVHQWMESRMGLLDDSELAAVESQMLSEDADQPVTIANLLSVETTAIPLAARTRNSVIDGMTDIGVCAGLLWDKEKMAEAIKAREELQSTAMDNGVALLHPRRPQPNILAEGFVALGLTGQGIPFGGSRHLTDVFWLVCSVDERSHLQTLARISRLLVNVAFLDDLRNCSSPAEAHTCVEGYESKLNA